MTRRAALTVVIGLTLTGAVVGGVWSVLAPPAHGVIALTRSGQRVQTYLGSEWTPGAVSTARPLESSRPSGWCTSSIMLPSGSCT